MEEKETTGYQQRLNTAKENIAQIKSKINSIIALRVIVFLAMGAGIYFLLGTPTAAVIVGIVGTVIFGLLVKYHGNLTISRKYHTALSELNQLELDAFEGKFEDLDTGKEFLDPEHDYSYDIDLFGQGSFFQFFNRTRTLGGKRHLAKLLTLNSCDQLDSKQEATIEISQKTDWRQHFIATADIIE